MKKPELLAPAGNFEKLEIAVHYGADAVYMAGKAFSLRNFSGNFTDQELADAVTFAHDRNVKVYLACNIYSRNQDQKAIEVYLEKIGDILPDAVIISDPGILRLAKKIIPRIDVHLSTQANTTNLSSVKFWQDQGVKRVNLARELTLKEISEITTQPEIEVETFIHGAMCISYSGRCLLSSFLSGRDSNQGMCSHPCRWKYSVVEEMRPNEFHPVMEDERGSYIFNSRDLCMIEYIPQLIDAGIHSLKIEGRMKGINYLASVVKTYRNAIDAYMESPKSYKTDPEWVAELAHTFHRTYSTGFYFGRSQDETPNYDNEHQGKIHSFIGKITRHAPREKWENTFLVEIRNKLTKDDQIEILSPKSVSQPTKIIHLTDPDGIPVEAVHPNTSALLSVETACSVNDIVRKR